MMGTGDPYAMKPSAISKAAIAEELRVELDKLKAENEALRKGIDPAWSRMDQSWVIEFIREKTNFDADKLNAMIQFAVECAQYVELNPCNGPKSDG